MPCRLRADLLLLAGAATARALAGLALRACGGAGARRMAVLFEGAGGLHCWAEPRGPGWARVRELRPARWRGGHLRLNVDPRRLGLLLGLGARRRLPRGRGASHLLIFSGAIQAPCAVRKTPASPAPAAGSKAPGTAGSRRRAASRCACTPAASTRFCRTAACRHALYIRQPIYGLSCG
jgi:hypothetical protein